MSFDIIRTAYELRRKHFSPKKESFFPLIKWNWFSKVLGITFSIEFQKHFVLHILYINRCSVFTRAFLVSVEINHVCREAMEPLGCERKICKSCFLLIFSLFCSHKNLWVVIIFKYYLDVRSHHSKIQGKHSSFVLYRRRGIVEGREPL